MTDQMLFTFVPYVAAVGFVAASMLRLAASESAREHEDGDSVRRLSGAGLAAGGAALAVVALHVLLLAAPQFVLHWNRDTSRLFVLELGGAAAGIVCAIATLSILRRHVIDCAHGACSMVKTVALTLIAIGVVSGVVIAVGDRWASSWSVVTLTPYVASLARLAPRTEFIAAAPFLVRLHVFCTFAIVALVPFTSVGSLALVAFIRTVHAAMKPASRVLQRGRTRMEDPLVRLLRSPSLWSEEEN
jgi:nitrate reductase gamma subunit